MMDKRFDEITIKEVPLKIAEAFLGLETELRVSPFETKPLSQTDVCLIKKKANQMKARVNTFIDSQVERIILESNIQSSNDSLNSEELVETQSQRLK